MALMCAPHAEQFTLADLRTIAVAMANLADGADPEMTEAEREIAAALADRYGDAAAIVEHARAAA
jgi:hypothetical protein